MTLHSVRKQGIYAELFSVNTSHSLLPLAAQCFLLVSRQAMLDATHLPHVAQHLLQPLVLQQGVSKDCWGEKK